MQLFLILLFLVFIGVLIYWFVTYKKSIHSYNPKGVDDYYAKNHPMEKIEFFDPPKTKKRKKPYVKVKYGK